MINAFINETDMREEYGLILKHVEISPLVPNIFTKEIVGRNGVLDYTSFYGEVTYQNRPITMEFELPYTDAVPEIRRTLEERFSGQVCTVSFSDDLEHYWRGRMMFDDVSDDKKAFNVVMILDAEPKQIEVTV